MLESRFQGEFLKKLRLLLPGCIIMKNDSSYLQGVPDYIFLWRDRWGTLEFKRRRPRSSRDFEPNQEWYIDTMNDMSFSRCVYPENEEEVLDEIQHTFTARRKTRVSQR
jgi:hypothetical protein